MQSPKTPLRPKNRTSSGTSGSRARLGGGDRAGRQLGGGWRFLAALARRLPLPRVEDGPLGSDRRQMVEVVASWRGVRGPLERVATPRIRFGGGGPAKREHHREPERDHPQPEHDRA